ncbi:recombinase family protein [Streptomyces mirabilis]|uniref:recombinase family protein n=1 Tax=Streptomyces mirabilis TaxID=68239 RepID=UPI0036B3919C
MPAGPLAGMYDPSGHGKLLLAFFAAVAETEWKNIRESTLEGLDAATRKGKHGGRPAVITEDMLHTVLRGSGADFEQYIDCARRLRARNDHLGLGAGRALVGPGSRRS